MGHHADTASPARRRAFWRDRSGAAAIEFAIVALPFLALLCATVETGVAYFADSALDNATGEAARLIRTGQAQQQGFDKAKFRDQVCVGVTPMFDCSKLKIDVRTSSDFASMNLAAPPLKPDGSLDDSGFLYSSGHGRDVVVVRAYYDWPVVLNLLASDTASQKMTLGAVAAFRNEPFTW